MITFKVIHEVSWLPNDVAERLQRLSDELNEVHKIVSGLAGEKQKEIDNLSNRLNQVASEVEAALKQTQLNLKEK